MAQHDQAGRRGAPRAGPCPAGAGRPGRDQGWPRRSRPTTAASSSSSAAASTSTPTCSTVATTERGERFGLPGRHGHRRHVPAPRLHRLPPASCTAGSSSRSSIRPPAPARSSTGVRRGCPREAARRRNHHRPVQALPQHGRAHQLQRDPDDGAAVLQRLVAVRRRRRQFQIGVGYKMPLACGSWGSVGATTCMPSAARPPKASAPARA